VPGSAEFYEDQELEEIKRRKLLEYQRQLEAAQAEREAEEARKRREELLRRILTPEARARLANLRIVRPELVEALETQLIQLAYAGRIQPPITDEELKRLLMQLMSRQRETEVRVRFTKGRT